MVEQWLDSWEHHVVQQQQSKKFLSSQTAQGLRVTLRSSRELTAQLLNDGFSYVMTAAFNQDAAEVNSN